MMHCISTVTCNKYVGFASSLTFAALRQLICSLVIDNNQMKFCEIIRQKVVSAKEKGKKTEGVLNILAEEEKAFLLILFDCYFKVIT